MELVRRAETYIATVASQHTSGDALIASKCAASVKKMKQWNAAEPLHLPRSGPSTSKRVAMHMHAYDADESLHMHMPGLLRASPIPTNIAVR